MKRSEFIKLGALGVGACAFTDLGFANILSTKGAYTTSELMGKTHPTFYGDNYNLRKKASEAFKEMRAAATKEGIKMHSQSSFRSFNHQLGIWNRKYDRFRGQGMSVQTAINKIIEYSTIPGTSRHHWGTDLDIIDTAQPRPADALSAKHFRKGGRYEKLHFWLTANAHKYGFCLVYTNKEGRKGFKYEPWHFSFAEISKPMLKAYNELDLKKVLRESPAKGSKNFTDEFIAKYKKENIMDINPDLLKFD